MECKTCIYAEFERTPTGRIKQKAAGKCLKQGELMQLAKDCAAPCLRIQTFGVYIWPNTNATNCSHWKQATRQQRQDGGSTT